MSFKKILVFLIVIFFHLVVLGVVYVSTREVRETEDIAEANDNADNKIQPASVKGKPFVKEQKNPTPPRVNNDNTANKLIHVVGTGDYLGKIASKYKVLAKDIIRWNKLKNNGNLIAVGQALTIYTKK